MQESPAQFTTRLLKVSLACGIKIKDYSHAYASRVVLGETANSAALNDTTLAERLVKFAHDAPDQCILLRPLARVEAPPRETAASMLERANAEHRAKHPSVTQTTELTDAQKKFVEKHGVGSVGLALANEASHAKGDGK